jgi:hypothetical protein
MAPCNWDIDPTALGVCADWADYTEAQQANALALTTLYLWAATGRQYGACPITVRPSQSGRTEVLYQSFEVIPGSHAGLGQPGGPFLFDGRWFNAGCASACCGNRACAIVLRGPVASVEEVVVGDETIPASAYRVDITGGAYLLVRIDGECWPTCQDFSTEVGEPGSFAVSYSIGREIPLALQIAAAMLACEYAKAITGGPCKLPARMTRMSRQGVEVEIESPNTPGSTGIKYVDNVVASLNPSGLKSPPLILSPDLPENCDRVTVIGAGS